jgi:MFS family permease
MGFRPSFVLGGLILLGSAALVWRGLPPAPPAADRKTARRMPPAREVATVSLIVLGGSTQVFFLTAILPQVLPALGVPPSRTLEVGGIVIFASGVAAALGALAAPRIAELFSERRMLVGLLGGAALAQALMALCGSAWSYGAVRFVQVLCIAPVFPVVVARVAQHAGGEAIGIVNSARIGASFLGPVLATTVLAWTSPVVLYLFLAVIGGACVPLAARMPARAA